MKREEFNRLTRRLIEGVKVEGFLIVAGEPKRGRFAQEFNLDLFVKFKGVKGPLLHAKVFLGRGEYRDWVELFGISKEFFGESYFGSRIEGFILDEFSKLTGRLFVEYFEDMETVRELSSGVPPALSRLGFELARRGFTWFKDWYFPEGLMEGGHKLQAEKPSSAEALKRHAAQLGRELEEFLHRSRDRELRDKVTERFKILQDLWNRS